MDQEKTEFIKFSKSERQILVSALEDYVEKLHKIAGKKKEEEFKHLFESCADNVDNLIARIQDRL